MEILLIINAVLLAVALLQAMAGILVGRPYLSVAVFFCQTSTLTVSTVLMLGFEFNARILCAWVLIVFYLFIGFLGIKHWKKADPETKRPSGKVILR
jgi:hypothetical protein